MNKKRLRYGITTLAVGLALAACADAPTSSRLAPEARPSELTLPMFSSAVSRTKVEGLRWKTALETEVTASATIGALGGTIAIPERGFRMIVPPGAVLAPTQFVVKALPGRAVAYDFEPAGSKFLVPLIVSQAREPLANTIPPIGFSAQLGYFPRPGDLNQALGVANVTELAPTLGATVAGPLMFPVNHFSGYIVCWGRNSRGGGDSE